MCGWGAKDFGGLGSVVDEDDLFLPREGEAAREDPMHWRLRPRAGWCNRCEFGQDEGINMCTRKRKGGWEEKEGIGLTYGAEFVRGCPQMRRIPMKNLVVLAFSLARGKEGKGRGGGGQFIGAGGRRIRQGVKGIEEGRNLRTARSPA
jgi:hypothetical protein